MRIVRLEARSDKRWRRAGSALLWGVAVLALVSLAGCGVTSTSGTGAAPNPTSTSTGTKTPAPPSAPPAAQACPAGASNATDIGSPALILTDSNSGQTNIAKVGELVVVKLPATRRWSYSRTASRTPGLTELQPFGVEDKALNQCIWSWRATAAGTQTLAFGGAALCPPGQVCPQLVMAEDFTVQVS